jgi:hypothetical protein
MLFEFFALLAWLRGFARAGKGLSSAQFGAARGNSPRHAFGSTSASGILGLSCLVT